MKKKTWSNAKLIIILIFAILVTFFAVLNSGIVQISFGFASVKISQAIVILISMTLGALLMYIISIITEMKQDKIDRDNEENKTIGEKSDKKASNISSKDGNLIQNEEKNKINDIFDNTNK